MGSPRSDATAQSALRPDQAAEVRKQLEKLLTAPGFSNSQRKAQLLRYLVEAALAGRSSDVSEYALGLDVFERPDSFDPRTDSTVRAEVSRLRAKLKEYYATQGRQDPVLIDFSSRGYTPSFIFLEPAPAVEAPAPEAPARSGNRMFLVLAIALIVIAAAAFGIWRWTARSANQAIRSVVVLPFVNLSGNSANDYLADGMTEELTNQLAQWQDLRVVARTSAFQFKGKGIDVREIGRLLGVDAVLEGSIDRQGDRLRVVAQLIRASNGFHIWSHEFESESAGEMTLQDDISKSIAALIRGNKQPPGLPGITANSEANDLYLQGMYQHSLHTADSERKAEELFRAAIAKDPNFGNAYIGVERTEVALIHLTAEAPGVGLPIAKQALEKAIELDPHNAEAHGQMAFLIYVWDWDWPRAEREFENAIRNGAQSTTRSYYASALATHGRFEESHRQFRIAQDLDPLGEGPRINEATAYSLERKYKDAERLIRDILNRDPKALDGHIMLGAIAASDRDCKTSTTEFRYVAQMVHAPVATIGLAIASGSCGDAAAARKYLNQVESGGGGGFASPYQLALAYAFMGDRETAMSYLEKSAEAKEGQVQYIKYEPAFEQMRSDPRFIALENEVGLGAP